MTRVRCNVSRVVRVPPRPRDTDEPDLLQQDALLHEAFYSDDTFEHPDPWAAYEGSIWDDLYPIVHEDW